MRLVIRGGGVLTTTRLYSFIDNFLFPFPPLKQLTLLTLVCNHYQSGSRSVYHGDQSDAGIAAVSSVQNINELT